MDKATRKMLLAQFERIYQGKDREIKETLLRELALLWKYYKLKRHR